MKLLNLPTPATRVLFDGSVGSNTSAPIERELSESVSGVQVGADDWALSVRQTPPLTVPMKSVLALTGCGATTWTAPATALLTAAFSACPR